MVQHRVSDGRQRVDDLAAGVLQARADLLSDVADLAPEARFLGCPIASRADRRGRGVARVFQVGPRVVQGLLRGGPPALPRVLERLRTSLLLVRLILRLR